VRRRNRAPQFLPWNRSRLIARLPLSMVLCANARAPSPPRSAKSARAVVVGAAVVVACVIEKIVGALRRRLQRRRATFPRHYGSRKSRSPLLGKPSALLANA
jgi:hypothetical protein